MSIFDIVDQQKKQTEQQLARGGGRTSVSFWRPEAGENHIRIMPEWENDLGGQFWREVAQHWNVSEDQKGPILCPKQTPDLDGDCPICDLVSTLMQDKSNTEAVQFAKEIRAKRTYLLNVIVKKDPVYTAEDVASFKSTKPDESAPFEVGDPKIQIYACPITVFDHLLGIITSSRVDITDLKTGRDVIIKKIPNKNRIKTRYEVYPSLKEEDTNLKDPAIPNLSNVGFVLEYDKMVALLGEGKAADLGLGYGSAPALPEAVPSASVSTSDVEEQMRQALGSN